MKFKEFAKEIVCKDGFKMSVQASKGHYCTPREDYPGCSYTAVEVGYPSADPGEAMAAYQESSDRNDRTDDIYPYVPIKIVMELIASHGGIVEGHMPYFVEPEPVKLPPSPKRWVDNGY